MGACDYTLASLAALAFVRLLLVGRFHLRRIDEIFDTVRWSSALVFVPVTRCLPSANTSSTR